MKIEHVLPLTETHTETHKLFYQRVAAIISQDDDINGCCVIGHTDSTVLWFVLTEMKEDTGIQLGDELKNIQRGKNTVHHRKLNIAIIFFNRDIYKTVTF